MSAGQPLIDCTGERQIRVDQCVLEETHQEPGDAVGADDGASRGAADLAAAVGVERGVLGEQLEEGDRSPCVIAVAND